MHRPFASLWPRPLHQFITGAGGFLQNVIQGWSGVRILPDRLGVNTPLLPAGVGMIKLRQLHWRGFCIDASFNVTHYTAQLSRRASGALVLVDAAGAEHSVTAGQPVVVPVGPLSYQLR